MTTSVRAPSWHDDVHTCTLMFLSHVQYIPSDLRCNFIIFGYGIFLSLHFTILICGRCLRTTYPFVFYFSFVSTMWRHFFLFSFVSTLYRVLSPCVSTMDSVLSPPVSMLESISSWFDLTLTTFPIHSLVEGGTI